MMRTSGGRRALTTTFRQRSVWEGIRRGGFGRCPNCCDGRLFTSYLKVAPNCPACVYPLAQHRADDGPAYFTILIVGHLVLAPLLLTNFILTWPLSWVLGLMLPSITLLSLVLLPRVKGAFVGVQWAVGDRSPPC